jgi:hypothetical protein
VQTVDIGNTNIIKVPVQDREEPYYQVVLDLMEELNIVTVEAVAAIRAMIIAGEVLESESRGMIMLLDSETIKPDPYQVTKSKFQDIYTDSKQYVNAKLEGSILTALAEEEAVIVGKNETLTKDAEFRGRRRSRKQNETTTQTRRNET